MAALTGAGTAAVSCRLPHPTACSCASPSHASCRSPEPGLPPDLHLPPHSWATGPDPAPPLGEQNAARSNGRKLRPRPAVTFEPEEEQEASSWPQQPLPRPSAPHMAGGPQRQAGRLALLHRCQHGLWPGAHRGQPRYAPWGPVLGDVGRERVMVMPGRAPGGAWPAPHLAHSSSLFMTL